MGVAVGVPAVAVFDLPHLLLLLLVVVATTAAPLVAAAAAALLLLLLLRLLLLAARPASLTACSFWQLFLLLLSEAQ
jgi:hypothetical protein